MATILEYLEWRGDVPFSCAEFNPVDAAILAQLAYFDFRDILPADRSEGGSSVEVVSWHDAMNGLQAKYEDYDLCHIQDNMDDRAGIERSRIQMDLNDEKTGRELIARLLTATRYREIGLSHFEQRLEPTKEEQFAALCFRLGEFNYISFRGTDDSLIGWKENFNMTFCRMVPSQTAAADYLIRVAPELDGSLILGGHSKGGNLALFAGLKATEEILPRIRQIYNFDGPGLHESWIDSPEFQQILPLIKSFVPEDTVIGMLLENSAPYQVVKSLGSNLDQHSLFLWQTTAHGFVPAESRSKYSIYYDRTISDWLYSVEPEQRELFIDCCYRAILNSDAENFSDVITGWKSQFICFMRELRRQDDQSRKELRKVLRMLINASLKNLNPTFDRLLKKTD